MREWSAVFSLLNVCKHLRFDFDFLCILEGPLIACDDKVAFYLLL